MYIEALKDIIKDLVNLCGEENDSKKAITELERINHKIESLESTSNLSSYEKMDLDVAKVRKDYWEKSAAYIGYKIIKGFEEGETKENLLSLFNMLYERAYKSFNEINALILDSNSNNIWDVINKKNIDLIKLKAKRIKPDNNINYSNVAEHYKSKKTLIENVLSSLNEKKILSNETITLYNDIIKSIADEIRNNNDVLLSYNEKKYSMAYILCEEKDYIVINEEIEKLREIKTFNESQLKVFNLELEKCLKEKEMIEKEISSKQEELKQTEEMLEQFREKTLEGEYVSKENVVEHDFEIKQKEEELKKLELAKNLLYINLERVRDTAIDIISKYDGVVDPMTDLIGEFTSEEIKEIKKMMKVFDISKEEAIKTFELKKEKEKEEEKLTEYMDEFDFSLEEAKEALENEKPERRFWNPDENL